MFLWNATFHEDPGLKSPGLLLGKLLSMPKARAVCFAAACTLHACNRFIQLQEEGSFAPFHADLLEVVSESTRGAWLFAATHGREPDLTKFERELERLMKDHPEHPSKKCNEDPFVAAAERCVRSARGEDTVRNAARAAKNAHFAVCSWFKATNPDTPKTSIGSAEILAAERRIPQCVDEISFQGRCLQLLVEHTAAELPTLDELVKA